MDETSIQALGKSLKVVVPKSFKKATAKALPHFNHHMTLILAVSADGTALPRPTVILPLQTLPALCDPVIDTFDFAGTETGPRRAWNVVGSMFADTLQTHRLINDNSHEQL